MVAPVTQAQTVVVAEQQVDMIPDYPVTGGARVVTPAPEAEAGAEVAAVVYLSNHQQQQSAQYKLMEDPQAEEEQVHRAALGLVVISLRVQEAVAEAPEVRAR